MTTKPLILCCLLLSGCMFVMPGGSGHISNFDYQLNKEDSHEVQEESKKPSQDDASPSPLSDDVVVTDIKPEEIK